jgi:hypothetical protein
MRAWIVIVLLAVAASFYIGANRQTCIAGSVDSLLTDCPIQHGSW